MTRLLKTFSEQEGLARRVQLVIGKTLQIERRYQCLSDL